mgnify:CR=1 FL=1
MNKWNLKGVTKDTWARTIALFLVLINQISIGFFNHQLIPFAEEQIYEGVSTILTIIIAIWTSWKNNSFTAFAQEADLILKEKKKGKK